MEEQKSNHKPVPGIEEALHPEIGNGSALEGKKHDFILRIPDPSIQLADLINIISEENDLTTHTQVVEDVKDNPLQIEESALPEISKKVSDPDSREAIDDQTQVEIESDSKPSAKKSSKKKKESKADDTDDLGDPTSPAGNGKRQKVGKLLKKASKSVRKKEESEKTDAGETPSGTEQTLSPFTTWLKNLAGTDYVHPYEDDFAIEQSSRPGKEGITETFADLLAAQGYKDQAREMYLKLMEKYPEKSGFFAAKIEAL